jgi:hypothetical protein
MNMDDLILVSVDDHVVEPPDVFEKHLPAKYQDLAPKLKERDPFQHVAKEQTTVGALRKQAEGHDVWIRSMGRGRIGEAGVNIAELAKTAQGR